MKIISVVGARPQFIKVKPIIDELRRKKIGHILVHTGQHYDYEMSKIFFDELNIPEPDYNLEVGSNTHGKQTAFMLERIEKVLLEENPNLMIVYGDTNSTLAGALAAKKLHIKVAHIEAGLRSSNMEMPEEINRVLTDRISDILFCPTDKAVQNLEREGFGNFECKIVKSGDVMQDTVLSFRKFARKPDVEVPGKFVLVTVHRPENTDNVRNLESILSALNRISREIAVFLPVHPRTRDVISKNGVKVDFALARPISYLEMIYMLQNCSLVITDSGGLQKEGFFLRKPCVTLRNETEWTELVDNGVNMLAGSNTRNIYTCYKEMLNKDLNFGIDLYGDGKAAGKIVKAIGIELHGNRTRNDPV